VLRVLGNLLDQSGFEHDSSDEVLSELRLLVGEPKTDVAFASRRVLNGERPHGSLNDVPMYDVDSLVRRAPALQRTREAQAAARSEPPA